MNFLIKNPMRLLILLFLVLLAGCGPNQAPDGLEYYNGKLLEAIPTKSAEAFCANSAPFYVLQSGSKRYLLEGQPEMVYRAWVGQSVRVLGTARVDTLDVSQALSHPEPPIVYCDRLRVERIE
jgi:hypothetical protein